MNDNVLPVMHFDEGANKNGVRLFMVYATVCLALFTALFHDSYGVMWGWWQWDDYSHCCFVPLIVLYLIWEKRNKLLSLPSVPSWSGLVPLSLGIGFYLLGELGGEFYIIFIGSWLVLAGIVLGYTGCTKLKTVLFPLCFLVAMFPFPRFITNNLTLKLKLISSRLGVALMQLQGLAAYREGNIIDLGFTKLQVVDACSGLRYFFPLIMLAILLVYFIRSSRWQKLLVVLSAIPVAVVTNGLRIASVGILYQYFGKGVAEGFFHDLSGWFIFMVSFVLLLLELRLLKRLFPLRAAAGEREDDTLPATETGASAVAPPRRFFRIPPQALAVWAVLAAAVIFSGRIDAREKTAMARPFDRFPLEISGWRGVRTPMEKAYFDELKFDDYVMADYRDSLGKSVSFYTAYYGSQSKGESIHSPASCLPGSGWVFEESGEVAVPGGPAGDIRVNRAFIRKGAQQELTYYWFPQRGRSLTTPWQMKLYTFWDAVTRRRTDGALVRIITNVSETEKVTDAEARLQAFTRGVLPVLAEFLPR